MSCRFHWERIDSERFHWERIDSEQIDSEQIDSEQIVRVRTLASVAAAAVVPVAERPTP